jgi:predicted secreted protein
MGIAAFGTLLKIGDGGTPTEVFTTIAEVTEIGGPELSLDTVDGTTHSSTGGWEEVIPTILRSGEVSFTIQYDPVGATHDASTGLIKDMTDKTLRNFQLVFPDTGSTTWTISAYVTGFSPSMAVDGKLSADCSLKLSGQPTLA